MKRLLNERWQQSPWSSDTWWPMSGGYLETLWQISERCLSKQLIYWPFLHQIANSRGKTGQRVANKLLRFAWVILLKKLKNQLKIWKAWHNILFNYQRYFCQTVPIHHYHMFGQCYLISISWTLSWKDTARLFTCSLNLILCCTRKYLKMNVRVIIRKFTSVHI